MKITEVKAHALSTPIPERMRVESGAGLKLNRQMILVEVRTDEGVTGVGSPSGPYDLAVLKRAIEDVIGPQLIGEDPANINYLWHKVFHGEVSRNLGHRSVGIAAMSGVDIALWDLKGRVMNQPIHQLLGGKFHTRGVRAYASSIYWDLTPEQAADELAGWVEQGFTAAKLKVGRAPRKDAANLRAMRKRVGADVEILVDANQSLSRHDALAMLRILDETGCYWFEEPLSIDDIEGHRILRAQGTPVRIATGENLYTRNAFNDYIRNGAIDVLQADASRAGGITEALAIAASASSAHLAWNPHTFNDIITVAANLHLVAALPHPAMFEWDITHNDLMTRLASYDLKLENGLVQPPQGPGLGFEIDWDFVAAHAWKGEPAIGAGHGMKK
ncbi:mandelate racemase/muconate lactonizing enzyme family protein [Bordetella bronchiseptica]|uniref:Mandelate racemase n=1 Tax=Bordetella genomosp. 6 TaxID=463024 RepID=A0ABX4FDU9_9BORD|nr:mandelate racemase/muconate lactonizing enzyme family protein [Bordetella genomosp. 6]OZI80383.1 mandelate racemase [Bordetella genomosp. 6]